MKAYKVKQGTPAVLMTNYNSTRETEERDFVTRQDLLFTETVVDPIKVYNGNVPFDWEGHLTHIAEDMGYYVFGGPEGGDTKAKYFLCVHQKDLEVV